MMQFWPRREKDILPNPGASLSLRRLEEQTLDFTRRLGVLGNSMAPPSLYRAMQTSEHADFSPRGAILKPCPFPDMIFAIVGEEPLPEISRLHVLQSDSLRAQMAISLQRFD
jgi:hypothetical protein